MRGKRSAFLLAIGVTFLGSAILLFGVALEMPALVGIGALTATLCGIISVAIEIYLD